MPHSLKKGIDFAGMRHRLRARGPLADEMRFLKTWFESPRLTGAVSPSGRFLARAMAQAAGAVGDGLVVELGPGTGPVTRALIERGVPAGQLILVEYEATFCRLLAKRFPEVRVVQGDAFALRRTLAHCTDRPIRAIVSSLPLLNQPAALRSALIEDAFALMAPGGVFVQFTYGMASPIPRPAGESRFSARATAPIWLNLPPARVWTYRADKNAILIEPMLLRLRESAERFGARCVAKKREAENIFGKQRARVRDIWIKEAEGRFAAAHQRRCADARRDPPEA